MANHQEIEKRRAESHVAEARSVRYPPLQSIRLVPPEDLCTRLLATVEKAAAASGASMDDLRSTVEEFTVVLKQQGASPEAVLIALKALIRQQTFPFASYRTDHIYGDPVRQNISTWSIKEFFRQESSP